jgi:hypothetical protein
MLGVIAKRYANLCECVTALKNLFPGQDHAPPRERAIGVSPTRSRKCCAKDERDMPALAASSCNVQGKEGLACIAPIDTLR